MVTDPIITIAKEIATDAHSGQTRWDKVTPYITHPLAVAEALQLHPYVKPWEIAAALLHDVLEDTLYREDMIVERFQKAGIAGSDISRCMNTVETLTKKSGESYSSYVRGLLYDTPAMRIKILDCTHNMSCFDRPKGSLYDKYDLLVLFLMRELGDTESNLIGRCQEQIVTQAQIN
jgi:guanosine-3',5'-bis(diphosphate) 3'-pyrophosphohydrolase